MCNGERRHLVNRVDGSYNKVPVSIRTFLPVDTFDSSLVYQSFSDNILLCQVYTRRLDLARLKYQAGFARDATGIRKVEDGKVERQHQSVDWEQKRDTNWR